MRLLASIGCLLVLAGLVSSGAQADDSFVPEWSKKAVWYQIFPERFRNGDSSNDPRLVDQDGSWPHSQAQPLGRGPSLDLRLVRDAALREGPRREGHLVPPAAPPLRG